MKSRLAIRSKSHQRLLTELELALWHRLFLRSLTPESVFTSKVAGRARITVPGSPEIPELRALSDSQPPNVCTNRLACR